MARKKRSTTTYLVMVHDDGSPTEVLLPDGRLALLVPPHDFYPCTTAFTTTGVIRRLRGGAVEFVSDGEESPDAVRENLIFDGENPRTVRAMKLETQLMVSFD